MRKLFFPLLVTLLVSAVMVFSQGMPGMICSGGQIACWIPGATVTGSGTSQVVTLTGGLKTNNVITADNSLGNGNFVHSLTTTTNSNYLDAINTGGQVYFGIANSSGSDFGTSGYALLIQHNSDREIVFGNNSISRWKIGAVATGNALQPYLDNTYALCSQTLRCSSVNAVGALVNSVATSTGIVTESYIPPTSCSGGGCALSTGSLNSVGTLTTTTTGPATITVNFSITATNGSACQVQNETTANILKPTSTTTALVITGTTVSGDKLSYQCQFF